MKTATLPALRVDPKLRDAAERALRPDETLSRLMESALESYIAQREAEDDFLARGLHSAQEARKTNEYVSAADVVAKLEKKLAAAKKKAKPATGR
ncbi:YlcI/YnfO family protein [Ramlibacter sp. WS9]|uniref:YlcI/YnfO family protein n=1 Tax=Ramlibacter sp. WS9 TaxID=1882741 RepID=UPI00114117C0|nr:YlcI/YnfO family protein [Ramlibacter sp. WS9]ROZ64966.1 prevent-host-death protein [Ramlibacter sp. WS9]